MFHVDLGDTDCICGCYDWNRRLLPAADLQRVGVCAGRSEYRGLDDGLCLWNLLFQRGYFYGYAGQFGWSYGVSSTWIGLGNAFIGSMLAWILLGNRARKMTRSLGVSTMPEYFEKRYNSTSLKTASALIVFLFLIPYTASVYNGCRPFLPTRFPGSPMLPGLL